MTIIQRPSDSSHLSMTYPTRSRTL